MSRRRRKVAPTLAAIPTDDIRVTLQRRARSLAAGKGHILGVWTSAKKKEGKGAQHATCRLCAGAAFVLPHGEVADAAHRPAIVGEAVFRPCQVGGRC